MRNLYQDICYGARILWRSPGFTLVAALSLALGIGANTAIFSVVDAVLLRALPFAKTDDLVIAWKSDQATGDAANGQIAELSIPEYNDWRNASRVFADMAAMPTTVYGYGLVLTGRGDPVQLERAPVSASFFPTLGVSAAQGRVFTAEEDRPGAERVVVLSQRLWQNRFHSDRDLIGQHITLNGSNVTVVGIMPADFNFPSGADLWTPLQTNQQQNESRGTVFLQLIGRLKSGVTKEGAQVELNDLIKRVAAAHSETSQGDFHAVLTPVSNYLFGNTRATLWLLLAAAAFLLFIAAANTANLLLARATKREKEIAVRAALGATRARLLRQFLTESLTLAAIGGGLGVLIAYWLVDLLVSSAPVDVPRIENVHINAKVLIFTCGLTALTAIAFGLMPALTASQTHLNDSLKEGSNKLAGERSGQRLRRALIVAEVAISLILLIGAGLLFRSFQNLRQVDLGYDSHHVLTAELRLHGPNYDEPRKRKDFYQQLLARLGERPEVAAAGAILIRPLEGAIGWEMDYATENQSKDEARKNVMANYEVVTPHYFRAVGIPLRIGRDFTEQDKEEAQQVVVISETLARRLFGDVDPLGKRIKLDPSDADSPWRTVIGVAGDARYRQLQDIRLDIYVPYRQSRIAPAYLAVRTNADPATLIPVLRREVAALDSGQALTGVVTMESLVASSLARPRFIALLMSGLALLAALLAITGIYSVISFTVTQRTHEIGIRVALGAREGDVLRLVVKQGLWLTIIGLALGTIVALTGTRILANLLYGVSATDPLIFVAVPIMLLIVALIATYLPARRATKVDPLVALRYE